MSIEMGNPKTNEIRPGNQTIQKWPKTVKNITTKKQEEVNL